MVSARSRGMSIYGFVRDIQTITSGQPI